ncbi:hypothetical protein GXN76_01550 [Kroppenstedtia pulmonis]|uniref:Uncharacterized protein n=1 Tax=Kroppenstedtia pulmonis TaxID=1380685 RepID=A0A7D4CUH6_9BACL|nr:hypothetical protein [Kroppenstedtia pulmonis]QKG83277.1 hypothetical protein GXN76_01550 [Kroppenstedtia pulmonis]
MITKKLQAAVFTATICSFLLSVSFPINTSGVKVSDPHTFPFIIRGFQIYTPFIFLGVFIFGVPVSIIADKIAGVLRRFPSLISFALHIFACALLSVFISESMVIFVYGSIVATVFFMVYQWIGERDFSGSSTFLFFAMLILWTVFLSFS